MNKRRAFTLIELLVVIAIIALLMSILMPALSRIKTQTKAVICQSNLHQWGLAMICYTEDNRGFFPSHQALTADYLKECYRDERLLLCPMAVKSYDEGATNPYAAHYYYNGLSSYGCNTWMCSAVTAAFQTDEKMWKTISAKGGNRIPMIFDCAGYQNASPWHRDEPPDFDGQFVQGTSYDEMRYACLNRHNEHINMVFFDIHVRKVGLKELWELEWHRNWNPDHEPPPAAWNDPAHWMYGMEDYYMPY
ncbi:MAG: type II secretion system protein [Planctomycetota bacterium]|jgi:prepilin-type N-terminal cleavage/methylation domain-containing protein